MIFIILFTISADKYEYSSSSVKQTKSKSNNRGDFWNLQERRGGGGGGGGSPSETQSGGGKGQNLQGAKHF